MYVTTMRLDVVSNTGCYDKALLQVHRAQWMRLQLPLGTLLPAT